MAVFPPSSLLSISTNGRASAVRLPYIHRSVRAVEMTTGQLLLVVMIALTASIAIGRAAPSLMDAHGRICLRLLDLAGVPAEGTQPIEVFGPLGSTWAPVVPFLPYSGWSWRVAVAFATALFALLMFHWGIVLGRDFLVFLMTLLILPAIFISLGGHFEFSSVGFTQIWIRFECVVWLLLPWVSASRFFAVRPSAFKATLLLLVVQLWAFAWSAVRLAFCLGVFHYTGVLFLPLAWFCLGLLGDLLYVIVFYSIAVRHACIRLWGERA